MGNRLLKLLAPVLFIANLVVILVVWWHGVLPEIQADMVAGPLVAFGRLAGLLAFYLILWQIMFIGRVGWIEKAWGHDKLSRFHHFFGLTAISILFFHPILLMMGYSKLAQTTLASQFWLFLTSYYYTISALIAYLMFLGIVVMSLWIVRKWLKYETWYYIHFTLYVAIVLAFIHQPANGHDLADRAMRIYWWFLFLAASVNVLYYRLTRPIILFKRHEFRVKRIEKETHNVHSVTITGKNLERFKARAGQFIIVRFLAKGFWWEAHPFSFSEMPSGQRLRITPKAVGDFTKKIPTLPVGTKIIVEGPLGRFTADRAPRGKILLIAGGIGITPLRSLFEEFVRQGREVSLIYAAQTEQDFALKDELNQIRSTSDVHQIAKIHYMPENKIGRLTPELIKQAVPDVAQRFVYLCGPPPMMKAVREQLESLGVPKKSVLYEKFQLG